MTRVLIYIILPGWREFALEFTSSSSKFVGVNFHPTSFSPVGENLSTNFASSFRGPLDAQPIHSIPYFLTSKQIDT
jgi:hypothetical protein